MNSLGDLSFKAFKRADTNIQQKWKKYFLTHYPHCSVPGFNMSKMPWIDMWDLENVMGLHQSFPYSCDLPKPLLPPVKITSHVLEEADPALRLVSTKMKIDKDIHRFLNYYTKHKKAFTPLPFKKDTNWKKDLGSCHATLPRYVADLAEIIEMDPDPHFAGKYDWYYTGGTLTAAQMGGKQLLVFPYMDELVTTPVTSLQNSLWKPNLSIAASSKIENAIYEVRVMAQSDNCRILGRSKNDCTFYSLREDCDKPQLIQVYDVKSKTPYIGADLNPINCNKFCTLNVEREVTFSDMVSSKTISRHTVNVTKILDDKWGSVRFVESEPDVIVFVDRCCLHYLDTRDPYERPVLSLCPKAHLENCESLTLAVPSSTADHNYIASYHSLLTCDRRSPQACVHQKWTHQFKSAPLFATVHTRNENEIIVLGSQLARETAIIINMWNDRDDPHSYNLPYVPPSVLETLKESQLQGKCLDPSLRKRLELCNAGISLISDDNGELSLFRQNSIGDVFYQCITHQEPLDKYSLPNSNACYAMEAWEKRILLQDRLISPLIITDRTNMVHAVDNFTNEKLQYEPPAPKEFFRDPKWKQSLEKLGEYKDILAPELLAVWEVSEDQPPATQPGVPNQKVWNWLEAADGRSFDGPTQEEPDILPTPINTQELVSVSQQLEVIDLAEDVPQESYYPPVKVKPKKKFASKKQSYVAGF